MWPIDLAQVDLYLSLLELGLSGGDVFTFRFCEPGPGAGGSGKAPTIPGFGGMIDLSRADALKTIDRIARERASGFCLHTTLNRMSGLGSAKSSDVRGVRVLCVDIDRVIDRNAIDGLIAHHGVDLAVESSPGKYHFYWKISSGVTVAAWSDFQAGLAWFFKSDPMMAQVSHQIRVPGIGRVIGGSGRETIWIPRVIWPVEAHDIAALLQRGHGMTEEQRGHGMTEEQRGHGMTEEEVREKFSGMAQWILESKKEKRKSTREVMKLGREYERLERAEKEGQRFGEIKLNIELSADLRESIKRMDRNNSLFSMARRQLRRYVLSNDKTTGLEAALSIGKFFNQALRESGHPKGALDEAEMREVCENGWKAAVAAQDKRREAAEERGRGIIGLLEEVNGGHCEGFGMEGNGRDASEGSEGKSGSGESGSGESGNGLDSSVSLDDGLNGLDVSMRVEDDPDEHSNGDAVSKAQTIIATNPYTELALRARVFLAYRSQIRRVDGQVFAFNSRECVWEVQAEVGKALLLDEMTVEVLQRMIREPDFDEKHEARWMSGSKVKITVGGLLSSNWLKRKYMEEFDAHPWLFFCANGVLDMRTRKLRDARPEDYLLARSGVYYDPNAVCPGWEKFVSEIFPGESKAEMRKFLQKIIGHTLSGDMNVQKINVHVGEGANGKSTVLKALRELLGGYGVNVSGDTITERKNSAVRELERVGVQVEGKRGVIIDDLGAKRVWNEAIVKGITAQRIPVRRLYSEIREVPNRGKFYIACNDIPSPESWNEAMRRRVRFLVYGETFEATDTKAAELNTMIEVELSGILNWALDGFDMWFRDFETGTDSEPEEMKLQALEYAAEHATGVDLIKDLLREPAGPVNLQNRDEYKTYDEILEFLQERIMTLTGTPLDINQMRLGRILSGLKFKSGPKIGSPVRKITYRVEFVRETVEAGGSAKERGNGVL